MLATATKCKLYYKAVMKCRGSLIIFISFHRYGRLQGHKKETDVTKKGEKLLE